MTTKTFLIVKRGRKYFECLLQGKQRSYKAKLLINDLSKDFAVDDTVTVLVRDVSTHSGYGSSLTFEPTNAQAEAQREAEVSRFIEQEKWLDYAETDARGGQVTSNAIQRTLAGCNDPRLAERVATLKARLEENKTRKAEPAVRPAQAPTEHKEVLKVLHPRSALPPFNVPVGSGSSFRVYTETGGYQRIGDDDPSVYGNQLLGYEGEWGVWCLFRWATEEDLSALEA